MYNFRLGIDKTYNSIYLFLFEKATALNHCAKTAKPYEAQGYDNNNEMSVSILKHLHDSNAIEKNQVHETSRQSKLEILIVIIATGFSGQTYIKHIINNDYALKLYLHTAHKSRTPCRSNLDEITN